MPPTAWNLFANKIYKEGKSKNPNYQFKNALVDASKRKSEMGHNKSSKPKGSKNKSRNASMAGGRRSRKRRKHH